jgi:hypothetical protein
MGLNVGHRERREGAVVSDDWLLERVTAAAEEAKAERTAARILVKNLADLLPVFRTQCNLGSRLFGERQNVGGQAARA